MFNKPIIIYIVDLCFNPVNFQIFTFKITVIVIIIKKIKLKVIIIVIDYIYNVINPSLLLFQQ